MKERSENQKRRIMKIVVMKEKNMERQNRMVKES